jgi:hypothetical protein
VHARQGVPLCGIRFFRSAALVVPIGWDFGWRGAEIFLASNSRFTPVAVARSLGLMESEAKIQQNLGG